MGILMQLHQHQVNRKYTFLEALESALLLLGLFFSLRVSAAVPFSDVNKKIFTPICAECHSGASPAADMDLTNYDSVMKKGVAIPFKPEESLIVKKTEAGEMPMGGDPLKPEELALIKEWIKGGALNTTIPPPISALDIKSVNPRFGAPAGGYRVEISGEGFASGISVKIDKRNCEDVKVSDSTKLTCVVPQRGESGKVTVDLEINGVSVSLDKGFEYRLSLGPTYSALYVNVFKPRCVGCHSGNNPPKGLDFSTYDSMMAHRRAIIPFDTKKSRAYKKVSEGEMPRGGPPLSNDQIQAIGAWIRSGAQNN